MRLIDIFLTANANLFRSKLRTILTIIAIFIGGLTLTLTNGIGSGISSYIDKQLGNLGANNVLIVEVADSSSSGTGTSAPKVYDPNRKTTTAGAGFSRAVLTQTDITKIAKQPGVTRVEPEESVSPDYIQGTSPTKYQVTVTQNIGSAHLDLAAGQNLNDTSAQNQVILPVAYVSSLGFKSNQAAIGQTVTLGISNAFDQSSQQTGTVVGVQQAGLIGGGGITVNTTFNNALYAAQTQGLPEATKQQYAFALAYFDPTKTDAAALDTMKANFKTEGYNAQTVQDTIGVFKAVISGIIDVLDAFGIIALLAASFGIINTLLMAVQERTKEIGLMKAMGMNAKRIFLLFSLEAVLIGFWGSLIGVAVAEAIGHLADHAVSKGFLSGLPGLQLLAFPAKNVVEIMLLIMGIAFLAGTLPAWRAARQNPIDALRYE
jgi:putative ABC transport system permease protein